MFDLNTSGGISRHQCCGAQFGMHSTWKLTRQAALGGLQALRKGQAVRAEPRTSPFIKLVALAFVSKRDSIVTKAMLRSECRARNAPNATNGLMYTKHWCRRGPCSSDEMLSIHQRDRFAGSCETKK